MANFLRGFYIVSLLRIQIAVKSNSKDIKLMKSKEKNTIKRMHMIAVMENESEFICPA